MYTFTYKRQGIAMSKIYGTNDPSFRTLEHHIRNSLAAVLGSAELLKGEVLTTQQQIHVDNITKAGDQLLASLDATTKKSKSIEKIQSLISIQLTRVLQRWI